MLAGISLVCVLAFVQVSADQEIQETQGASVSLIGKLGGSDLPLPDAPRYSINVQNFFLVHVKDVSKIEHIILSHVTVSSTERADRVTLKVLSHDTKAEVGRYKAKVGIVEAPEVTASVTYFVIDDSVVYDDSIMLYAQDFEMQEAERPFLSEALAKKKARVHAYSLLDGSDLTEEVVGDERQLTAYVNARYPHTITPLDFRVVSPSKEILSVRSNITTLKEKSLPSLGSHKEMLVLLGLGIFVILGLIEWRRRTQLEE